MVRSFVFFKLLFVLFLVKKIQIKSLLSHKIKDVSHVEYVHDKNLTTCPPDGDMTEADKKKALSERQKRAALRSSVIQELRQQYSDAPEEIRDRRDFQSDKESRDELHRCLTV